MNTIEEYEIQLEAIETAVAKTYREHPSLVDNQVERAYSASITFFNAIGNGRDKPKCKLSGNDLIVYNDIQIVSYDLIGKEEISEKELLKCLKRLRKSAQKWSKRYGVRGYLDFISQFV